MEFNNVLSFWFDDIEPSSWWLKSDDFDALINSKFLTVHTRANNGELYQWRSSAAGRLAEIIVLDQFSRNIFRDTPRSFSSDSMALALAQETIAQGLHHNLTPIQRSFLYMPYMHSESLIIHDAGLKLYEENGIQSNIDFEIKHRDIIERFGRYPHRNTVLNRNSTPDEIAFLKEPNSSF